MDSLGVDTHSGSNVQTPETKNQTTCTAAAQAVHIGGQPDADCCQVFKFKIQNLGLLVCCEAVHRGKSLEADIQGGIRRRQAGHTKSFGPELSSPCRQCT